MRFHKLVETLQRDGTVPKEEIPRAGVRARSAEGYVGRVAGLEARAPSFDEEDFARLIQGNGFDPRERQPDPVKP